MRGDLPVSRLLPRAASLRVLLVAAHPDDETVGAGALLGRLENATLVTVTDGAPRNPALRPPGFAASREAYAAARREELAAAAALAGLAPARVVSLGLADQEAAFALVSVTHRLADLCRARRAEVLLTHPYEGGHPDHDACAFAVRAARDLLARERGEPPALMEMTSYHAGPDGALRSGRFLPPEGEEALLVPTGAESERRRRMREAHASQSATLAALPEAPERFRAAPRYDFTRAPHEGALWYERLGWPLDGARWRLLARQAAGALGLGKAA